MVKLRNAHKGAQSIEYGVVTQSSIKLALGISFTRPVSYVISNQLTGATSRVARDLKFAKIDEWQISKSDDRLLRIIAYALHPETEADSTNGMLSENIPLAQFAAKARVERPDSSSKDDIPLMELPKCLKLQENKEITNDSFDCSVDGDSNGNKYIQKHQSSSDESRMSVDIDNVKTK
ncbi:hypothetical protein MAR_010599, partial [Mya arenaria]